MEGEGSSVVNYEGAENQLEGDSLVQITLTPLLRVLWVSISTVMQAGWYSDQTKNKKKKTSTPTWTHGIFTFQLYCLEALTF